jgi:hypothetical protein
MAQVYIITMLHPAMASDVNDEQAMNGKRYSSAD